MKLKLSLPSLPKLDLLQLTLQLCFELKTDRPAILLLEGARRDDLRKHEAPIQSLYRDLHRLIDRIDAITVRS